LCRRFGVVEFEAIKVAEGLYEVWLDGKKLERLYTNEELGELYAHWWSKEEGNV
jgi:hypothetical protein